MKKFYTALLALAFLAVAGWGHADESNRIQNFAVSPDSAGKQLYIKWSPLAIDSSSKISGYALQWSDKQTDMRTDKAMRLHFEPGSTSTYIRAADFNYNTTYYFRVYAYYAGSTSRVYYSDKSSQILKWNWVNRTTVNTEWIAPADPVISSAVTDSITGFPEVDLMGFRDIPFDKSVQFQWSNSNLASSDFDGHQIVVSKSSDLSSPLITIQVGQSDRKAYLEGLLPSTTYYAQAAFYKNENGIDQTFGESEVNTFTTAAEFTGKQLSSFERTLDRMKKAGLGRKFMVGAGESSTTTATAISSSSNETVRSSASDTKDSSAIRARIRELQAEITEREKEIDRLEGLLGTKTTATASTRSSRAPSALTSLRSRLLSRLGQK